MPRAAVLIGTLRRDECAVSQQADPDHRIEAIENRSGQPLSQIQFDMKGDEVTIDFPFLFNGPCLSISASAASTDP